jgi:hypothetical protein
MSRSRWFSIGLPCGTAMLIVAGLVWGMRAQQVRGENARSQREAVASSRPSPLALQASAPVTTYLPAISRDYPPPPPVFGVQMIRIENPYGLQQALDAKVKWVRYHAFPWDLIEPSPGNYAWQEVNETSLRNAYENGLKVIAIVQYAPGWAQKYPGSACGPIASDHLDDFARFLAALVQRYKGPPYNVKYWELGNEPDAGVAYNRSFFGCWGETTDAYYGGRYYAEMLKRAYPAIKGADPDAQVLIGGLLLDRADDGPNQPSRFLEGILVGGGGPYFDVVSFHAYSYYGGALGAMGNANWPGSVTAIPEKTTFVREVLGRYGYAGKKLVITEAALLCAEDSAECLETQAMYVPRAYAEAAALGLESQSYYRMINETWRHTGLLQPNLTPKPVYYAYQAAASFLSSCQYSGPVTGYEAAIEGYSFSRYDGQGYVDVIWAPYGTIYAISLPPGASAFDLYGNPVSSSWVSLDFRPVYVQRPQ